MKIEFGTYKASSIASMEDRVEWYWNKLHRPVPGQKVLNYINRVAKNYDIPLEEVWEEYALWKAAKIERVRTCMGTFYMPKEVWARWGKFDLQNAFELKGLAWLEEAIEEGVDGL